MNIKNEYYVPQIEEFYVGFECEIKNSSDPKNFEWESLKITGVDDAEISCVKMTWTCYDTLYAIECGDIRVKYLSRECIESLGWVFEKLHTGTNMLTFSKFVGKYKLTLDIANYNGGIRIYEHGSGRSLNYFFGTIKNLSEFKILCKQLGI